MNYAVSRSLRLPLCCDRIAEQTREHFGSRGAQLIATPLVTRALMFMCKSIGAKRVLEIGSFTSFSSIALLHCGGNVELVATERDADAVEFVRTRVPVIVDDGDVMRRLHLVEGDAERELLGLRGSFDLVFVDANKMAYRRYYDALLDRRLVHANSVIAVDNTLFRGLGAPPPDDDGEPSKRIERMRDAVDAFNEYAARDARTTSLLLPFDDGLSFHLVN
jgi:predicted O-methyltransferase YrrM